MLESGACWRVARHTAFAAHNVLTFGVGKDGTYETTLLLVYTVPTNYEFFYDTPAGLRPIRDERERRLHKSLFGAETGEMFLG